jgi:hypothetical protein
VKEKECTAKLSQVYFPDWTRKVFENIEESCSLAQKCKKMNEKQEDLGVCSPTQARLC